MTYAEIATMPTREAFRSLAEEWHDRNEAGCCSGHVYFCDASANWARGYLAALADVEAHNRDLDDGGSTQMNPDQTAKFTVDDLAEALSEFKNELPDVNPWGDPDPRYVDRNEPPF